MLKIKLSISFSCAITLFFILYCFNGIEIFNNNIILLCLKILMNSLVN